jgi:hypothetical protein
MTALLLALSGIVGSACGGKHPAMNRHIFSGAIPAVPSSPVPSDLSTTVKRESFQAGRRVRGVLRTEAGDRLITGTLIMTAEGPDASAASVSATLSPDGSFTFNDVPPGTYVIRALARTGKDSAPGFALFRVAVRDQDIDNLALTLLPGATIIGHVRVNPSSRARQPLLFERIRVRAPFADSSAFGEALTGNLLRDGSFVMHGVMAGTHLFVVEDLPPPWAMMSVIYRGQDVTDIGVQADSGRRMEDVRITVTDIASEVSGAVRDGDGRIAAGALVLIVPLSDRAWPVASRRFARLRTNAGGQYSIRGLPAGDYRIVAASELDEHETYRADIIRAARDTGLPLTVDGPETRIADLQLVLKPLPRGSTSR